MFSTLRTRFGIPGVISVIALVFAMFGGAYAASNSSNNGKATASKAKAKKGPRGPKGATGPAGPAGAQGPAGPAGAKGDAGANGANGAAGPTGPTGAAGAKGATGAAGATGATGFSGFTETLPAGKTETGVWAITQTSTQSLTASTAISFPIPIATEGAEGSAWVFTESEVAQEKWGRKESNTSEPCTVGESECMDTGCRGTLAEPTAPPGVLCAYTAFAALTNANPPTEFLNFNFTFNAFGKSGAILGGANLNPGPSETAKIESTGTWAVTAPQ